MVSQVLGPILRYVRVKQQQHWLEYLLVYS